MELSWSFFREGLIMGDVVDKKLFSLIIRSVFLTQETRTSLWRSSWESEIHECQCWRMACSGYRGTLDYGCGWNIALRRP